MTGLDHRFLDQDQSVNQWKRENIGCFLISGKPVPAEVTFICLGGASHQVHEVRWPQSVIIFYRLDKLLEQERKCCCLLMLNASAELFHGKANAEDCADWLNLT